MISSSFSIGVGRFRTLEGGQGLEYGGGRVGGGGGGKTGQIPSRHMTVDAKKRRCIDAMCPLFFFKSVPNNHISHLKI